MKIQQEVFDAANEIYERFPHASHGGSYDPQKQIKATAEIIQQFIDKAKENKEPITFELR